ncbi:MAG: hypothetical protein JWP01_2534 [Myxococcales bacterium]|nr:hypothetical protein [Myxococcales bacterium]
MLLAHSWLRWIVVAFALWVIVASLRAARDWQGATPRARPRSSESPTSRCCSGSRSGYGCRRSAAAAWRGGFGEPILLAFSLVHPALMIVATMVLHVGHARVARAPSDRKHRVLATTVMTWLAIVALAIPWPMLPWGRPLGRVELPATARAAAPATWARCVACHGATGHGDGPAAIGLSPRPRSFADRAWHAQATDAGIRDVIRSGGATHGCKRAGLALAAAIARPASRSRATA